MFPDKKVKDIRNDSEKRSCNMARIRSKKTKFEELISKKLSDNGIIFERNVRDLPGKSDFVIRKSKLLRFYDSEF